MAPIAHERITAVDVYRGLVLLLLLPDLSGGFGIHKVAERMPEASGWDALASLLTHRQWTGMSLWDFLEPSFVFLAGVSIALSRHSRRCAGMHDRRIALDAALRWAAIFLLGWLLQMPVDSQADQIWPIVVLTLGLPVVPWACTAAGLRSERLVRQLDLAWRVLLLAVAAWWVYANLERLGNYVFGHIFVIMAMCAPLALWAAGRRRPTQLAACVLILIGYWAFFALFPLPPAGFNPASVGVSSTDEWLTGFFAHWNKNANAAFHFDLWFLNQLPRTEPYAFHGLGLQTLTFIPESVTMILGVIAGQVLLESPTRAAERRSLLGSGVASVALGIVAGGVACPIVKSIWTPSWVLLSGGLALLTLGALREACHTESPARLLWPVVALGSNAVLLYVLASAYRWRIVEGWHTVLPPDIFQSTRGSLHDALFVLLVLWIIALALSRMKVFVKL